MINSRERENMLHTRFVVSIFRGWKRGNGVKSAERKFLCRIKFPFCHLSPSLSPNLFMLIGVTNSFQIRWCNFCFFASWAQKLLNDSDPWPETHEPYTKSSRCPETNFTYAKKSDDIIGNKMTQEIESKTNLWNKKEFWRWHTCVHCHDKK